MFDFLKFFQRTPDVPTPAHPAFDLVSLQWSGLDPDVASGCVLCRADFVRGNRLRQLVGILPLGLNMQVPVISKVLEANFKTINSDLRLLIHQFGLPIERSHRGVMLTASVGLCKKCAQTAEHVRQSEQFKKRFKVALPGQVLRMATAESHFTPETITDLPPWTYKSA